MPELSTLDILFRLLAAALFSAAIGYEREYRHKPAGVRTDILVGIGTAVMTIASIEIARLAPNAASVDISRIASTVLTGIGFIGAGTIIQTHGRVRGLTTAASIWVVAAIGLVCGLGLYNLALLATILALITLVILQNVRVVEENEEREEKSLHRKNFNHPPR